GRHAGRDGASSGAGGGTSAVRGEWLGTGRRRATNCTAGGDLPRGRVQRSPVLAAVCKADATSACAARSALRCRGFRLVRVLGPSGRLFLRARSLLPSRAAFP